jgi:serine protease AprX
MKSLPASEPPKIREHHVTLPDGVAEILHATAAHRRGITGRGVRVAVIDSGFYPHPFYESRGYRIERVPTRKEREPAKDEYGHGTAQLASLFAIAPEAQVLAIKCLDRDPSTSLRKALSLKPDILACAWGFDIDRPGARALPEEYRPMHRLLRRAVRSGICVVAAAGNGQWAFPGSMPEVISAGGAYYTPEGTFEPSDVSSEFESSFFPGRRVPDLCGLVGNRPHGRLLLVPVPPRARLARRPAFATIAAGEARALSAPGWAMFSGTSAATAMIAGAAALLKQVAPALTPSEIRELLVASGQECGDLRILSVEGTLRKLDRKLVGS